FAQLLASGDQARAVMFALGTLAMVGFVVLGAVGAMYF
ncbi:hypothetical protein LCGC14_2734040, partial [marine sediment metagenome]